MFQKEFLIHLYKTNGGFPLDNNDELQDGRKKLTSMELPNYIHSFLSDMKKRTGISKNTLITLVLNSYKNFLELMKKDNVR
jgi:heterodisulfide reductase subunit C